MDDAPGFEQRRGVGAVDTSREEVRSYMTNNGSNLGDDKRRRFRGSQTDVREESMEQADQQCIGDDTHCC